MYDKKRWTKNEQNLPVAINKTWCEHLIQWNWYNEANRIEKTEVERRLWNVAFVTRRVLYAILLYIFLHSNTLNVLLLLKCFERQMNKYDEFYSYGNETVSVLFITNFDVCKAYNNRPICASRFILLWTFYSKKIIKIRQNSFALNGNSSHLQICSLLVWIVKLFPQNHGRRQPASN